MATNNSRDVKMTLSVETLGAEDVKKLQTSILNLGKEAGDAAPEFEQLAAEIGKLGASAETLRSFEALAAKFEETAAEQRGAAAASEALATKLNELRTATEAAEGTQKKAKDAWLTGKAAVRDLATDLTKLKESYRQGEISQDAYKASFDALVTKQNEAKKSLDQLGQARIEANRAASAAVAAEEKVANALEKSSANITNLARAAEKQKAALDEAGAALGKVGLVADDAAASQARLKQLVDAANNSFDEARVKLDLAKEGYAQLQTAQESYAEEQARVARFAELWAEEEIRALRATAQEAQRVAALKEAISARIVAMRNEEGAAAERAAQEQIRATTEAYAREDAEARRVAALKQAIRERLINLNREEAQAAEENARRIAAAAQKAAQEMNQAFSTLGVRSIQQVEDELKDVQAAMVRVQTESVQTGTSIAGAMQAGNTRIRELQRELRELRGELTLGDKAAGLFKNSMGQIAAGNLIADAIGALIEKVKEMARAFVTANVQAETMRRALTAVYKDAGVAADQLDFLRRTAVSSGVSITGISDAFVKFSAATASSNIPLQQTNDLFVALTRAAGTLGLSSERVELSLSALGQIASKGVVSMEELRQQLGDSLPGALSLTAKGLGITDAELIKLVETGRLASRDFFPALTKGLKELQGQTDGLSNTWERLKSAFNISATAAGDAGALNLMTLAVKALGGALGAVVLVLAGFIEAMFLVGKTVVAVAGFLSGDGVAAFKFLGEEVDKAGGRLNRIADSFDAMIDPAGEAAKRLNAGAAASTNLAAATTMTTEQINASIVAYDKAVASVGVMTDTNVAAAAASRIMGQETTDLGAKYTQLGNTLGKLAADQEAEIVVKAKGVKVAEDQAKALLSEAQVRDSLAAKVVATVEGNKLTVAAAAEEAAARTALAQTLAVELQSKIELAKTEENGLAVRKQALDQLKERLEKAQVEAAVSEQQLNALRAKNAEEEKAAAQEVTRLKETAAALKDKEQVLRDNSAVAAVYAAALKQAQEELVRVREAAESGTTTAEKLAEAERRVAQATTLASDAFADQVQKINANTSAKKASLELDVAGLQLELQIAKNDEARARRMGNEQAVRDAIMRQKNIEIQIAELQIQMQRLEAEGAIAVAKAKLAELQATGQLTDSKRIELETTIKLSEVKLKQVDVRSAAVQAMREEANALASSSSNLNKESGEVDKNTESWERNASARSKAAKAGKAGVDSDGFTTDSKGQRVVAELPTWLSIFNQLKSRGLSDEQAKAITAEFTDSNGQVQYFNNPGQIKYGRGTGMSLNSAVDEAAGQVLRSSGNSGGGGGGVQRGFGVNTKTTLGRDGVGNAGAPVLGGGYTVNVNINGSNTAIKTATQSDADALARLLASLGNAASTSTARTGG